MDKGINPLTTLFSKIGGNVAANILEKADGLFSSKDELKARENELRKIISDEVIRSLELDQQEINSARERETEISKSQYSTWLQKSIVSLLAIFVVVMSFGLFITFSLTDYISAEKKDIVAQMQGTLQGAFYMVLGYYFSASHRATNSSTNNLKIN